ncbi:acyltransferase family protein [Enterobacter sp. KB-221C9]|uniref:acyltransferase family protein n=1 Tax=Enterobacter sp. KB-221C9 TaxID=3242496 RepID=UPI003520FB6C
MEQQDVLLNLLMVAGVAILFVTVAYRITGKCFSEEVADNGRYESLDGLRGLAALSVAIHHSFFFFGYAKYGKWTIDYIGGGYPQIIIDYLGKGSVSVFFMITAFLFWGKILGNSDAVNWRGFYIKRFFRIVPLYLVTVCLSIAYVIATIKTPFTLFPYIRDSFYWLTFDFFGTPNINGYPLSKSIVAGVFWTLSYEWMFYFMLPVLSVFAVSKKSSSLLLWLMFGVMAFIYWFGIGINRWAQAHVLCFIIGAACAHMYKFYPALIIRLKSPAFSVIAVASLGVCVYGFDAPYSHIPTILIGITFFIVSCGNCIFGVLRLKTMKMLGAISFSVYLLHGITYTVLFSTMIKSGFSFHVAIAITIPVIIALSTISYLFIERKFISKGQMVTGKAPASAL